MHLHLASHLGTLDEPREGRDVGVEPKDDVGWTYPKDGRTMQVLRPEISPRQSKLTELTCVESQARLGAFEATYVFTNITRVLYV